MRITYLKPRSSFRYNLRSDTIWGLICWGIKNVYSEERLTEFINLYDQGKGLKVSSAFKFIRENGKHELLFPKPLLRPLNLNKYYENNNVQSKTERTQIQKELKKYKSVKYIKKEDFEKFLTGKLTEESYFNEKDKWLDTDGKLIQTIDVMHNTIDRLRGTTVEGRLFTKEEEFIDPDKGGLFFLMNGDEDSLRLAESALRFFSNVGFGGDSSIGKNHFDVEFSDLTLKQPTDPNGFLTLSLYFPNVDELDNIKQNEDLSWYELETRKGKFGGQYLKTSQFWKDSLITFTEGSVFKDIGKDQYGKNPVVVKKENNPENFDVINFGTAFNLPIKVN